MTLPSNMLPSTTLPSSLPHAQAVMGQLRSALPHQIGSELAVAPSSGAPCAVVYPDAGTMGSWRLCHDSLSMNLGFWVHAIGHGPEQAMWVLDHVSAALVGFKPEVPGRSCLGMYLSLGPGPMTRDQTIHPPTYLIVAEYTLISQPKG